LRTTCPACAADGEIMRNFNNLSRYNTLQMRQAFFPMAAVKFFAAMKPIAQKWRNRHNR
jgi:hypothetical protein